MSQKHQVRVNISGLGMVEQRQHRDGRRWGSLEEREKPPAWKPFCSCWHSLGQAVVRGGRCGGVLTQSRPELMSQPLLKCPGALGFASD